MATMSPEIDQFLAHDPLYEISRKGDSRLKSPENAIDFMPTVLWYFYHPGNVIWQDLNDPLLCFFIFLIGRERRGVAIEVLCIILFAGFLGGWVFVIKINQSWVF